MSFDNSDDRTAKNEQGLERSFSKSHSKQNDQLNTNSVQQNNKSISRDRSNTKQLTIEVEESELNSKDFKNNLTPNNRTKNVLMENNMQNNAY
mmetsp:Transcript_56967/g.123951  ORF Transcript_56967/g.123951 Transcript_56967/m.123951 type:complete len:93 (-) Transcript_56967:1216-1494(-)